MAADNCQGPRAPGQLEHMMTSACRLLHSVHQQRCAVLLVLQERVGAHGCPVFKDSCLLVLAQAGLLADDAVYLAGLQLGVVLPTKGEYVTKGTVRHNKTGKISISREEGNVTFSRR